MPRPFLAKHLNTPPSRVITLIALGWAIAGIIVAAGFPLILGASPFLRLILRTTSDPLTFSTLSLAAASFLGGAVGSLFMTVIIARSYPTAFRDRRRKVVVVLSWAFLLLAGELATGALYAVLSGAFWDPLLPLLLLGPLTKAVAAFLASSATIGATDNRRLPEDQKARLLEASLWAAAFFLADATQLILPEIMPVYFLIDLYGGAPHLAAFVLLGAGTYGCAALIGALLTVQRLRASEKAGQ